MSLNVRRCPQMSANVLKCPDKVEKMYEFLVCEVKNPYLWRVFVTQKLITQNVYRPSLRQGRAGFALPTLQHPRYCYEDPLPLDKGLSAAYAGAPFLELQPEAPHFPEARGGGHRPPFGRAIAFSLHLFHRMSSPFMANVKTFSKIPVAMYSMYSKSSPKSEYLTSSSFF